MLKATPTPECSAEDGSDVHLIHYECVCAAYDGTGRRAADVASFRCLFVHQHSKCIGGTFVSGCSAVIGKHCLRATSTSLQTNVSILIHTH